MSVAGGGITNGGGVDIPDPMSWGWGCVPYHVTYPMMLVMIPTPCPMDRHTCENIPFEQLVLQAVIKHRKKGRICQVNLTKPLQKEKSL